MSEGMTLEQKVARMKLVADGLRRIQDFESARYLDEYAANLSQPAQAVDAAMVERALTYRAWQEDGAVWPDAYGAEEQATEREQMRAMLSEALNPNGPKAYCRACQRAGMSNCGYFDECAGATCITCHRPFVDTRALSGEKAVDVVGYLVEKKPRVVNDAPARSFYFADQHNPTDPEWWIDGEQKRYIVTPLVRALSGEKSGRVDGWISVEDRLPVCDMKPNSFGVPVEVKPGFFDGVKRVHNALYGCRQTDKPNFYLYGAVFHPTHWRYPNSSTPDKG